MLIEVILGHAVALSIPKYSVLDLGSLEGVVYAALRSISGFGREAALQFIFLSGYFTAPILLNLEQDFNLSIVIFKRLKRLYPVLFLALFLTTVFDYFGAFLFHWPVYDFNGLNYFFYKHWNEKLFFLNLFSLQPTFSLTFGSNGPLWTIGYLIQFFMVATVLRRITGPNFISFGLTVFLASLMTMPVLGWEPALFFAIWCIGGLLRTVTNGNLFNLNGWVLAISFLLLLSIARLNSAWTSALLAPLIGTCLIGLVASFNVTLSPIFITIVRQTSKFSFAAYAVHMPVLFFCYGGIQFLMKAPQPNMIGMILFMMLSFFLIILGAYAVESLTIRLGGVKGHGK